MRQIKMNVNEFEGYAITVEVEGDLEGYARCFTHLFNNVRDSKELLRIENHYGSSDVTIYCKLDEKDRLVHYLKNFGVIKDCKKVLMYQLEKSDYDINKYSDAVIVPDFYC